MKETKKKIEKIVSDYISLFPSEYEMFLAGIRAKTNEGTGEIKKTDIIHRPLFEIPETLDKMLSRSLSEDELAWFWRDKKKEGIRWFAKKFKSFRISQKV
ncbi:MAG: hypothetical protein QXO70_01645 [Candidatus Pacearchaeota archaeon]